MRYTVLFDACVLYPAPLRDFLLRLSTTGLFLPSGVSRFMRSGPVTCCRLDLSRETSYLEPVN